MKEKGAAASQISNIKESMPNVASSLLDTELNDILGNDPSKDINYEGSIASIGV